MGSEVKEGDEDEYNKRDNNARETNADNEPEHNNNEISSIMDKQYVTGYG